MPKLPFLLGGLLLAATALAATASAAERKIDFNRDIRPILADKCFFCHGPNDKNRKADLRLDVRDAAYEKREDGAAAIVPGKPDASEAIRRVHATERSKLMPPPSSKKTLTDPEKKLLRDWIAQGAEYKAHWSLTPIVRPETPAVKTWARNAIDRFILERLEQEGLKPSGQAPAATLLRRLSLDLTGLPPTPEEQEAFRADWKASPDAAYERAVDRLLASPRFGEHMARYWLDAARYGDTHGLHLDNYREIWPYRDWVIRAFNKNLPYDRFVLAQLAGDLLPGGGLDDLVATGFLRCHVTTAEGGTIEEEYYVRNTVDRVDTNSQVFLGLTIGCARCHDHPYDPIKSKEYYGLFAFFNNIDGGPLDGNAAAPPPITRVAGPEQLEALAGVDKRLAELRARISETARGVTYDLAKDKDDAGPAKRGDYVWIDDRLPPGNEVVGAGPNVAWNFVGKPAPVFSGERSARLAAKGLQQLVFDKAVHGLRIGAGDKLFAHVFIDPKHPPKEIMLQWHTDGWKHRAFWGENLIPFGRDASTERRHLGKLPEAGKWIRLEVDAAQVGLTPGSVVTGWACTQIDGVGYWDRCGIVTQTPQDGGPFDSFAAWVRYEKSVNGAGLPKTLVPLLKLDPKTRTKAQTDQLLRHFLENAYSGTRDVFAPLNKELDNLTAEKKKLESTMPTTLVFKERPGAPREAYVLKRGEYDKKLEKIGRITPAALPPLPKGASADRLGLARWLVDGKHPLTARVAVNRFWQQVFGAGLVRTVEDFGTQGEMPSHPELLDWLAATFMEEGWDVKKLVKTMVLSATYRQSSRVTKEIHARDPHNRLFARAPRYRLDAEQLRDQALFVSGLLVEKVGGPSVKPPQPRGLWEAVAYTSSNTAKFFPDLTHEKVHRRSLYTFIKRTAPPPQLSTFDAPSREQCVVRRERTNTPLQALLVMNEAQYVEAARVLAQRGLHKGGGSDETRIRYLFQLVTGRAPDAEEILIVQGALADHRAHFTADTKAAEALIRVGVLPPDATVPASELAAWTMIGNLMLNLDEVLTKN
ncbi:MAG: PSD1 and planctomycete cytochrome C domain-containing protein [Gemmataceae bacterium]